jgi:type VI secretion system protein ImpK
VIGAGVAAVLAAAFLIFSTLLERHSDAALAAAAAAPPLTMPEIARAAPVRPPPPPPPSTRPSAAAQIHQFLAAEIAQGLVTVTETPVITRVQIRASGMFASGSATLQASFLPLLGRIGEALNVEPGRVRVLGHTDNQPIHTVQFPSNFQLSTARAEAARAVIGKAMQQPDRLSAEGHADLEPLVPNDTPAGREANRRIEIILQRQG